LGTCAHIGSISREAFSRVVIIPEQHKDTLIFGGFDPVIVPINYLIHGSEYEESVRWLFGDVEVCAINPRMPRVPLEVRNL
jgi:hypothetical protein